MTKSDKLKLVLIGFYFGILLAVGFGIHQCGRDFIEQYQTRQEAIEQSIRN